MAQKNQHPLSVKLKLLEGDGLIHLGKTYLWLFRHLIRQWNCNKKAVLHRPLKREEPLSQLPNSCSLSGNFL